ncbi:MAG: ATP-binding protein [Candidatus Hydrogenedentes bacterium]|jgi:chromosomal replication initiator protein DnaA|nr:ATP-binding protein [Candidatus Hydrogenedentota bacterium]
MLGFGSKSTRTQSRNRLGEFLVEKGRLRPDQIKQALAQQNRKGGLLGEILVDSGILEQNVLLAFLMRLHRPNTISLSDYNIDSQALAQIPQDVCERFGILPVDKLGRILTLAMVDPLDTEALKQAQSYCPDVRLKPVLCEWQDFQDVFQRVYEVVLKKPKDLDKRYDYLNIDELTRTAAGEEIDTKSTAKTKKSTSTPEDGAARSDAADDDAALRKTDIPVAASEEQPETAPPRAIYGMPLSSDAFSSGIRELAEAVQQSIDHAVNLVTAARAEQHGEGNAASEQLAAVMEQTLQSSVHAFTEALEQEHQSLAEPLKRLLEMMGEQTGQLGAALKAVESASEQTAGSAELIASLRLTLSESAQESAAALRDTLRQLLDEKERSADKEEVDPQQLAELLRENIGTVLGQGLENLSQMMQEQSGMYRQQLDALPPPIDIEAMAQRLHEAINNSLDSRTQSLVESLQSSITNINHGQQQELGKLADAILRSLEQERAAQQEKQEQLTHLVEAALESVHQSARLIESYVAESKNRDEKKGTSQRNYASVSAFNPSLNPQSEEFKEADARLRTVFDSDNPLRMLTFQNFFFGRPNTFSVKLAQAVATAPGGGYNPFFLYGGIGVGKTHLVSAIANEILARAAKNKNQTISRVGYLSASRFVEKFNRALRDDSVSVFRDHYCQWDVLILDDIQFLDGHSDAQEEFYHIFNGLILAGRQAIVVGDQPPHKLAMLEQRLVSRLTGGIVAELKTPNLETRLAILNQVLQYAKMKLPEDIVSFVALHAGNDMRRMIGALRKVMAYAHLQNKAVTIEEAQEILNHFDMRETI